MREQLESLRQQQSQQLPDLEAVRDRTLAAMKIGKQSQGAKAIERFIRELR